MKKFLALAAALVVSLGAMAQTGYIGGNIGVMHNSTDDKTTASILPEVGINIADNFAVGTTIGYSYIGHNDTHNHSFVLDPYVRWTFFRSGIVNLFVDGGIDLSLGSTHYKHGSSDTSATVGIGFKPGIAVNLNEKFSVVAHVGLLGYTYANHAAKVAGKFSGGGLDLSNALSFGLYYNF